MKKSFIIFIFFILFISRLYAQDSSFTRKGIGVSASLGAGISGYFISSDFTNPGYEITYGDETLYQYIDVNSDTHSLMPVNQILGSLILDAAIFYGLSNKLILGAGTRNYLDFDNVVHKTGYVANDTFAFTMIGIIGVYGDYFLSEDHESFYISAIAGLSYIDQPFQNPNLQQIGFGASVALGYQLSKLMAIEGNICYTNSNLSAAIKDEIESAGTGIAIDGTFNSLNAGVTLKIFPIAKM